MVGTGGLDRDRAAVEIPNWTGVHRSPVLDINNQRYLRASFICSWSVFIDMRPITVDVDANLYECVNCGGRTSAPEVRMCADCGSTLKNISTPRDL